jgi:excisionase family DNA binding protein
MENILLSKKSAASLLSISVRTLENLVSAKELEVKRIGRRVVISRLALEDFARRDHPTRSGGLPFSRRSEKKSRRKGGSRGGTTRSQAPASRANNKILA